MKLGEVEKVGRRTAVRWRKSKCGEQEQQRSRSGSMEREREVARAIAKKERVDLDGVEGAPYTPPITPTRGW